MNRTFQLKLTIIVGLTQTIPKVELDFSVFIKYFKFIFLSGFLPLRIYRVI